MTDRIKKAGKRASERIAVFWLMFAGFLTAQAQEVFASSGDGSEIASSIDRITTISVTIISAIGIVVALYGVFEFAPAWGQHDSSQQTAAIKKIVAGLIMIFAGAIAGYITGKGAGLYSTGEHS